MRQDKQNNHSHSEPGEQGEGEGRLFLNIGKMLFLVAVLVAAWFLLDWLMGGK